MIPTLAALSQQHSVIKEYSNQQQTSGRLIFILHSPTTSKKVGNCDFHLLTNALGDDELSFLSVALKDKPYQRLASATAKKARQLLNYLYDSEDDFTLDTSRGHSCFIKKRL